MKGYWCCKFNTENFKVNIEMNEGGRFATFSFILFSDEHLPHTKYAGMIRLWLFGKEFIHWFKKR